ncbi:MAG: hypothetical protein LAO05_16495 [Acidobacteriia bacterium]|nr:hypothetical protein [Terriglobia bacterium]
MVIWAVARPVYNPALCACAQAIARFGEWPAASTIELRDNDALLGRSDLRSDSPKLKIPMMQIHFNLIPFLALVLALPRPFAGGLWRRLLVALGLLALSHALYLVWEMKALEALQMGPWSRANYSDLARDVYSTLQYFFNIPVTFALPLVLWVGAYSDRVFSLVGLPAEAGG